MVPAVSSTFDVVHWFFECAKRDRVFVSPLKIQRLIYLAQAYFAGETSGGALMPAMFVVSEVGPLEPNLHRILEHGQPTVSVHAIPEHVDEFLSGIWRSYGPRPIDALNRLVMQDPALKEAETGGVMSEISLTVMQRHYGAAEATETLRVVEGKRVKAWTPKTLPFGRTSRERAPAESAFSRGGL